MEALPDEVVQRMEEELEATTVGKVSSSSVSAPQTTAASSDTVIHTTTSPRNALVVGGIDVLLQAASQ